MDLSLIRKHLPIFDIENFNMFNEVISLKWDLHKKLTLEMQSGDAYGVTIEFTGVNSFKFEGSGQICGFFIKDMSAYGYEKSARYRVGDYECGAIEFYCSDILIKELKQDLK